MTREANQQGSSARGGVRRVWFWVTLVILAVGIAPSMPIHWLRPRSGEVSETTVPSKAKTTIPRAESREQQNRISSETQSKVVYHGNLLSNSNNQSTSVDRETMIRCLKNWVRKREGHDVEVVSSQDIPSLDGKPTAMNVLVTTNVGSGLTAETMKNQLAATTVGERILRRQLQEANQAGDIGAVNRLAGELTEKRTAFVATNGVVSYKLSVTKELPPVLAFWPGLPFETVREESARALAATKLDGDVGLEGLVHYTSVTALLCFTNNTGTKVYIDPFRVQGVSLSALQSVGTSRPRRADDGRDARITQQWDDYLDPNPSTPKK